MNLLLLLLSAAILPAANSDLLNRAGKAEEVFWEQLSAVNCVESVEQEELGPNGKVLYRQQSDFDYLAVLQLTGADLLMEESRSPIRQSGEKKSLPLLITNGFTTFGFIFHPFYQVGFDYSAPRPVEVEGRILQQVDFRQARGGRSPSVLKLREREYPIAWQGTAYLDPETASVVRIRAGLMSSMEDLGLKKMNADVLYERIEFKGDAAAHWMPAVATVEVETLRQHWRNVHRFTGYRLFVKQDLGARNERDDSSLPASGSARLLQAAQAPLLDVERHHRGDRSDAGPGRVRIGLLHPFAGETDFIREARRTQAQWVDRTRPGNRRRSYATADVPVSAEKALEVAGEERQDQALARL